MNPRRLSIKLYATPSLSRDELAPFIGLFHRFIQEAGVPGLLVDVADYAHVPDGPGVILIGHDVDYGIETIRGRTGLLTTRKRAGDQPVGALARETLARALATAVAIETGPGVALRFALDGAEFSFPDRLAVPNSAAAQELVCKELAPLVREVFGDAARLENAAGDDPRRMLTVRIAGAAASASEALARLETR